MEEVKWYENANYESLKKYIQNNLRNMTTSFISIGYYLKQVRDRELYQEDGLTDIWQFADTQYGISRSTASRWMAINDRFSRAGNSPVLADQYKDFGKSQLQEMLYLTEEQAEEVTPDMTVKEIREVRQPDVETEPESESELEPEKTDGPAKCITGKSGSGLCGAAAYCNEPVDCCASCGDRCNGRCGWLDGQEQAPEVESKADPEPEAAMKQECATSHTEEDLPGQMDIEDYPEVMPETEERTPEWFVKAYFDGRKEKGEIIKICQENKLNSVRGKKIQEYLSPYVARSGNMTAYGKYNLYYVFYRHAKGVKFASGGRNQKVTMSYTQLAAYLEELYGPFEMQKPDQEISETKDKAWFVKKFTEYEERYLPDLMKILRENRLMSDKVRKVRKLLGAMGGGDIDFGYNFGSSVRGIDFDADNYDAEVHMEYRQFIIELQKLYDPGSPEWTTEDRNTGDQEAAEEKQKETEPDALTGKSGTCKLECNSSSGRKEEPEYTVTTWPDLLADIPEFTKLPVMDYLDDVEKELKEFTAVDGLPEQMVARKQMEVAGLRLLLDLIEKMEGSENDE